MSEQWDDGTECADLYVNEGLDCRQIGARLGMHPVTVRLRLDAQGIPREHGASRRTSWAVREQIARLTEQGWSQLAIGEALGIDRRTVARWQPRLWTVNGLSSDSDAPEDWRHQEAGRNARTGAVAHQERNGAAPWPAEGLPLEDREP